MIFLSNTIEHILIGDESAYVIFSPSLIVRCASLLQAALFFSGLVSTSCSGDTQTLTSKKKHPTISSSLSELPLHFVSVTRSLEMVWKGKERSLG